jgi:hypothetical protein
MKFKTLYQGERAILINRNGEKEIVDGPGRYFLVMTKMEKLKRFEADNSQYIKIKFIDGRIVHRPG